MNVVLQVATPAEMKAGWAGWTIRADVAESPFGPCLIAENPRGICHLSFIDSYRAGTVADLSGAAGRFSTMHALQKDWPNAEIVRDDKRARELAEQIFMEGQDYFSSAQSSRCPRTARMPSLQPLELFVRGTSFQVKVWRSLLQIPPGCLVSYGRLAELVGNPNAARAVGSAVGKNPIGFLIPCHRVIRESGAIGGYAWGAARKRAIQAWEKRPAYK